MKSFFQNLLREKYRTIVLFCLLFVCFYLFTVRVGEFERENSVNAHLPNTFRVVADGSVRFATTMPPLAKTLLDSIPEVISSTRLRKGDKLFMQTDDYRAFTKEYFYVDSSFFTVFDTEILNGNARPLITKNDIVLTHTFSSQVFGIQDPIGKTIQLDSMKYIVAAIIEDEVNDNLDYDFLLSLEAFSPPGFASLDNWGWITFYTYVRLNDSQSLRSVNKQIPSLIKNNGGERIAKALNVYLQPADSIYYDIRFSEDGLSQNRELAEELKFEKNSFLFIAITLLIFFFLSGWRPKFIWMATVAVGLVTSYAFYLFWTTKQQYDLKVSQLGFSSNTWIIEFDHPMLKEKYEAFKTNLLSHPDIEKIGGANHIMEGIYGTYSIFQDGESPGVDTGQRMNFYPVSNDFFSSFSIPMLQGAFDDIKLPYDTMRKLVVNEQAAKVLTNDETVVGKNFFIAGQGGMYGQVVGVVKDFYFDKVTGPIKPLVCFYRSNAFNYVSIKAPPDATDVLNKEWDKLFAGIPLQAQLLNSRSDFILSNDKRIYEAYYDHFMVMGVMFIGIVLSSLIKL